MASSGASEDPAERGPGAAAAESAVSAAERGPFRLLGQGRVVEDGTHQRLMAAEGVLCQGVAGALALRYRITATAVGEGPAGTATRNHLVEDSEGRRWFVKVYPDGTDLAAEEQALALAEYARHADVPVPAVLRTADDAGLVATAEGLSLSVSAWVEDAETAEGGLFGDRWTAVGETMGRLHHALARHPAGPPRPVPARQVCDVARAERRLRRLLRRWAPAPAESEFTRWARRTAARRLDALPEVAALLEPLPHELTAQVVHGDLASPNLLMRQQEVAAVIDFRPPGHRSAAWELGRILLDPRTVLARPNEWITGLATALSAYRAANPALPLDDLLAVPRVAAGNLACSVYPLSEPLDRPGAVTPSLEAYGRARHQAATVLRERLDEAEETLHALLTPGDGSGRRPTGPRGHPARRLPRPTGTDGGSG
ncbi:phosphotransferase enzyme family protein [Streptomyces abyssomicinicus]|uniref:phosphotransferase enzyme family protein n=1 Tax=Streptomyces abyssomicinicus TaxID=574929 RepID=UPI001FE58692|nr:phosphotransferase [Streptomyces abyssomicinicus]